MQKIKKFLMCIVFAIVLIILSNIIKADGIGDYPIEDNYMYGIYPEMSVEEFKKGISGNITVEVKNKSEKILENSDIIGTAMKIKIGEKEYTSVVLGDLTGDGKITITDVVRAKLHQVKIRLLDGAYEKALDINHDGKISITDVTLENLISILKTDVTW